MTTGAIVPDEQTFLRLAASGAGHRVIAVTRRVLADGETPVGVYRKLAGGPGTFLLESAERGSASGATTWSRYSFIGVRCPATLTERGGEALWLGRPPTGLPRRGDPLRVLRECVRALSTAAIPDPSLADQPSLADLPPLTGGLVGYFSYDLVRRLEPLPALATDDLPVPELGLQLATDLVVLDHCEGSAVLVVNVILPAAPSRTATVQDLARVAYRRAVARLESMTRALGRPTPPSVSMVDSPGIDYFRSRTPDGMHRKAVLAAKDAIRAGECFQIVVSQRFERATGADPLDIYRALRTTNPSPYMYLLRFADFDIVGSSPEAHLKVQRGTDGSRRALLRPIAGTRWRGASPAEDSRLAAQLLADPKERAEHVMLVDLGRNDLGRVCRPGSIDVVEFATIERYSHVMHIVSTVVGELRAEVSSLEALLATFPAGTLTGAPKVRAMQLIEELEPTRRGIYGGIVGYLGFGGELDTAITIRTALVRNGVAYVQAGGGVVADSDPAAEERETRNKASAVLAAICAAETLRPVQRSRST